MNTPLYPLSFVPNYHYRIWGGDKLQKILKKDTSENQVGESWELSAVENSETEVAEGELKGQLLSEILAAYKEVLVGEKVWNQFGVSFPLLFKFIDAQKPLSVQVHPDDEWAQKHHNSFGKNEMWHILHADEGAELVLGFKKEISASDIKKQIESGTLEDSLQRIPVKRGESFYIPTGLVHAIGAGVLLAEIQQTSDITYRIYDYNRIDAKTGATRELHVEQALAVADRSPSRQSAIRHEKKKNTSNKIVDTPYFTTHYLPLEGALEKDYQNLDSFVVLLGIEGVTELIYQNKSYTLHQGGLLLLPASLDRIQMSAEKATLLEVYLP